MAPPQDKGPPTVLSHDNIKMLNQTIPKIGDEDSSLVFTHTYSSKNATFGMAAHLQSKLKSSQGNKTGGT